MHSLKEQFNPAYAIGEHSDMGFRGYVDLSGEDSEEISDEHNTPTNFIGE